MEWQLISSNLWLLIKKLAVVQKEDRDFYNNLPKALTISFDNCEASIGDVIKWFTEWYADDKMFDPKSLMKNVLWMGCPPLFPRALQKESWRLYAYGLLVSWEKISSWRCCYNTKQSMIIWSQSKTLPFTITKDTNTSSSAKYIRRKTININIWKMLIYDKSMSLFAQNKWINV